MSDDIFKKRRKGSLQFFSLLIFLTIGSIIITQYDIIKGLTGFYKALEWGVSNFYPDASSLKELPRILPEMLETVLMSIAATVVASVFALLLSLAGSKATRINVLFSIISRGIASLFRNIPLVAWAMVLMLSFGQSSLTGFIALFLALLVFLRVLLWKLLMKSEMIPLKPCELAGGSYFHIVFQAVLPASMPQIISWLLFMIETNIRDATLVGVLTGTGIGFSFELYYSRFDYHAASLVVILIVITVILIEIISNNIRRVIL